MNRIRCAWTALRENRQSGLSILIALCACALLLSLTLGLINAAIIPMTLASRKIGQERCRLLAISFAEVLDTELRKYTSEEERRDWKKRTWDDTANRVAGTGTFYNQVNTVLEDSAYACYDPGDPATVFSFELDDGSRDELYGDLEIRLRKVDLMDGDGIRKAFRESITAVYDTTFNSYGSFDYDGAARGTQTAEQENKFIRYQVRIDAALALGEDIFLHSSEYYREDCYQPYYTWHVTNLDSRPANFALYQPVEGEQESPIDGVSVFWDPVQQRFFRTEERTMDIEPTTWYWDEPIYDADDLVVGYDRHTWTEKIAVSYVYYDTNGDFHATYKHFVPTHEKDWADKAEDDGGV